ncbi:MAG: hypothetical protein K1X82_14650 [Bacteroidia bacterium]|nr:hypothetical protein [Bacteroidia bacterium]
MLGLPALVLILGIKDPKPSSENKALAELPKLDSKELDPFPEAFDRWFNDHFVFRNSLVSAYNQLFIQVFNYSPKPKLVGLGKEGWFYLMNNEINNYTGKLQLTKRIAERSISELNWRYDTCRAHGAEFMVVILPSKPQLYPEYLPSYIKPAKNGSFTSHFLKEIKPNIKCQIIDIRPALEERKKQGLLFYKTDNHWNNEGTYLAYRILLDSLNKKGYHLPVIELADCKLGDSIYPAGNITRMINMEKDFVENARYIFPKKENYLQERPKENYPCPTNFPYCWTYEEVRQSKDSSLPGLLVFRESFTNDLLMDLLGGSFSRSTYIFDSWEHGLDLAILQKEHPNLVICMVMEGFLDCFSNYPNNPKLKK